MKPAKKMKTLKVSFQAEKPAKKSAPKRKASKAMDFAAWVDHYVEMSKGNPV